MAHLRARRLALASATVTATLLGSVSCYGFAVAAPEESGVSFSSSFEDGQQQPDWVNTVETDASGNRKTSGVVGADSAGIPGNVTDKVVEVQANSEHVEASEVKENLVDGDVNSK